MSAKQILIITCILGILLALYYYYQLPERVATHFNGSGNADGFGDKGVNLILAAGLHIFLTALFLAIPFLMKVSSVNLVNLPHREYWLAPERKEETIIRITGKVYRYGAAVNLFFICINYLIFKANQTIPPGLDLTLFLTLMTVFFAYTLYWVLDLYKKFRKPKDII